MAHIQQGRIQLQWNDSGFSCHSQYIHFNTISEVDVYLQKVHYSRYKDGSFSISCCPDDLEGALDALIDSHEHRAYTINAIAENATNAQLTLVKSQEWLRFYNAVVNGDQDVLDERDEHLDTVKELTERIETLMKEYTKLVDQFRN